MSYSKSYLAKMRGKKVRFIIVNSGADLKVQFVSSFGDYKVKVSNNSSFASETIKIKIVDSFADVKLQKVTSFGDFEAYFDLSSISATKKTPMGVFFLYKNNLYSLFYSRMRVDVSSMFA